MSFDFSLTTEQKQLREDVIEVGKKYRNLVYPCDRDSIVPEPLFREMGERKWFGPHVPIEYGGMGKGAVEFAIITEEISRLGFMGHNPTAQLATGLLFGGTEKQKQKYLPKLSSGEILPAISISEPNAGSNWDHLKTTAVKTKDGYVLNGFKTHINYGEIAGVFVVYAKTDEGVSVFLIDKGTPGISSKKTDPIGLRMEPVADVTFKNCVIPEDSLLGKKGRAIDIFIASFNLSRVGNASRLIGISRGALEAAVEYAKNRQVGKYKVTDFQGIRWIVADLSAKIEAASLLRDKATWKLVQGEDPALEMAMAKLVAGNVAVEVTNQVFSLTGGWGMYRSTPFEKYWREAKTGTMGGGSLEVLKNFIARRILGKPQN